MEDELKVNDIMTKDVITIDADMPISEAADLLITHSFTGAPVMHEGKMVGIITEGDFLTRDQAIHLPTFLQVFSQVKVFKKDEARFKEEFQRFLSTKVRDIMTRHVVTVDPDTSINEVANIFVARRVNPIPVVNNGNLVGIIARSDIVRIFQL